MTNEQLIKKRNEEWGYENVRISRWTEENYLLKSYYYAWK